MQSLSSVGPEQRGHAFSITDQSSSGMYVSIGKEMAFALIMMSALIRGPSSLLYLTMSVWDGRSPRVALAAICGSCWGFMLMEVVGQRRGDCLAIEP